MFDNSVFKDKLFKHPRWLSPHDQSNCAKTLLDRRERVLLNVFNQSRSQSLYQNLYLHIVVLFIFTMANCVFSCLLPLIHVIFIVNRYGNEAFASKLLTDLFF